MSDVAVVKTDVLDLHEPALSATSDIPVIETKPDSQPAPEVKAEAKAEPKVEAKVEAAPDEGKKPAESAPAEQPEDLSAIDRDEGKPKPQGVQKKIDELTRNWREAERREEAQRQETLRVLALLEKGTKTEEKPAATETDPEPQRPDRGAFADITAYEEALANYADSKAAWSAKHAVKEALAEEAQKTEQRQIAEGQRLAREAYAQRIEKATEKYSDYKQVAESPDVMVSMPMAHAILHSEHGPELQYHLGKNPEEAKRISLLSPPLQLMEMGLLVARLTAPAAKEAPAPQQKPQISAAPKPLKPLESKSEPVSKNPQDMSMDEYAAYVEQRDRPKRAGART